MKKGLSDNQLIIISVIVISLSVFSILASLGKVGITGMDTTDIGFVNVTVPSTAEITVHTKSINFTGTAPGDTKNSYLAADVDTRDGMECTTDNHCGMNITNDGTGTTFINITIYESDANYLFTSGGYVASKHFLYNVTMQDPDYGGSTYEGPHNNCSVGYDQGLTGVGGWGYWRAVPRGSGNEEVAVCYLNASNTLGGATESSDTRPDVARIEFNITVPDDEPAEDKDGVITFTAYETS